MKTYFFYIGTDTTKKENTDLNEIIENLIPSIRKSVIYVKDDKNTIYVMGSLTPISGACEIQNYLNRHKALTKTININ